MTRSRRPLAFVFAAAVVSVALMYARTLHYGFFWDDFDVLRPWTRGDLWRAWVGPYRPWEPIAFYRPLTSTYYAAASTMFGFNALALHVIPLIALAVLAVLTARFVMRDTSNHTMAGIAAVLVSTHPTLATSMGPWIANQYHTFMTICLVAALLIWQRGRLGTTAWWWRAAPWLVAAAWFKEDGLLLPLALGLAQWWTASLAPQSELARPSRRAWLALGALVVALIVWRALWLPSQLGYGWRTSGQMLANLLRAPRYVLLWQVGPPAVAWPAMAAKAAILVASVWVLVRARTAPGARLIVTGITVMVVANLPLMFVSSEGRWHLIGWGAVLMTAGALGEWIARVPRWGWVASVAIVLALAASSVERVATFAPCSTESLSHDEEMAETPDLPPPLRAWISARAETCRTGHYTDFSVPMRDLTWGTR